MLRENEMQQNMLKKTYLVTKYVYESGRHDTIGACLSRPNAQEEIQDEIIRYIQSMDGVEQQIVKIDELNKLATMPDGHYIFVQQSKWTVVRKDVILREAIGWSMFGSKPAVKPRVTRVFDLDIVELSNDMFKSNLKLYKTRTDALKLEDASLLVDTREARESWGEFTRQYEKCGIAEPLQAIAETTTLPDMAQRRSVEVSALQRDFADYFAKYPRRTIAKKSEEESSKPMYSSLLTEINEQYESH